MVEVAAWMVESLARILAFLRDNSCYGVCTFILLFPLIKLLGRVLRSLIKTN